MHELLIQTLNACSETAISNGEHPANTALRLAAQILIHVAVSNDEDSALIMARRLPGNEWQTHVHIDYLSSSHDHFKNDFAWDSPEQEEQP